jgi:hypothetical protein
MSVGKQIIGPCQRNLAMRFRQIQRLNLAPGSRYPPNRCYRQDRLDNNRGVFGHGSLLSPISFAVQ